MKPKITASNSKIYFSPVDETSARAFLSWKYEPSYKIYNYAPENFDADLAYHLDPANNLYSMSREGELIGYCSFRQDGQVPGGDYSEEALDIGMMIKPELTGQGQGVHYAEAVIQYGMSKYHPNKLRVTILETNQRAVRVWEKNGFHKTQSFERMSDELGFVVLTKEI